MHRGYQPPSSSAADVPVLIDLIIQGPLYEDLMNPACRLTLVGEEFNGVPCWRGMNRLNSSNLKRHGKVVWLYRDTRKVWQITVTAADEVPPVSWPDAMLKNRKVTPIYTQPLKLIYPNSTLASLAQQKAAELEACAFCMQSKALRRPTFLPCRHSISWGRIGGVPMPSRALSP